MSKPFSKNKTSLKVKQLDVVSGQIVNIFRNRYQAACWIIDNDLTTYFYKSLGATRACIAGSITNSISQNKPIYGYKWILLEEDNTEIVTIDYRALINEFYLKILLPMKHKNFLKSPRLLNFMELL
jgi:hypothetical protein